jgi:hypothetical protein
MKKLIYILVVILVVFFIIVAGGLIYLNVGYPKVGPAEDITIEKTPERLARGEYLVNHVNLCFDCHSSHDESFFASPVIPGTEGKGGELFKGAPGKLYTSNITPAGLKDWTDGEIIRAITAGVDKDGNPLVPMMPYTEYRYMAKEDVYAVVTYLRTLPPIESDVPESSIDFPLNLIFRTTPSEAEPQPLPEPSDTLGTGKYLVRIAGCYFCHSPMEKGKILDGMTFAGGHEFQDPELGTVRSANITPDNETGLGKWTKEVFITRFKAYTDSAAQKIPISEETHQTVMPWTLLGGMKEADLGAIYEYLRTVKPVRNKVEKYEPAQKQEK